MDVPLERRVRRGPLVLSVLGALAVASVSFALTQFAQAPPEVARSSVWVDTVRRGELVREVSGPGTLVPEEIRFIAARAAGRVERILVQAGTPVEPDTVLLELGNPDVVYQALEAERQYVSAQAKLADLEATLDMERLNQRAEVVRVRSQQRDAERRAAATARLHAQAVVGELEYAESQERAQELAERLAIEQERTEMLARSTEARRAAQQAEVDRLKALASYNADLVASLEVRAGTAGVLQELPLEVGESVQANQLLAKVVQPSRLKAELRIPETQARDVRIGLPAEIDTRGAVVKGHVVRIDPAVQKGTVTVDVEIDGALPPGARPDLSVDGRVELERLRDVLYTGRPAFGQANGQVTLFRLVGDDEAERVRVKLGGTSVSHVEVVDGLTEGDRVILSDMSEWDSVDRIRID